MLRKILCVIGALVLIFAVFCGGFIFGLSVSEDDGFDDSCFVHWQKLKDDFLSKKELDRDNYICFSNGVTLHDVDIYAECNKLIQASFDDDESVRKNSPIDINKEYFEYLGIKHGFGEYENSHSKFSYSICEISCSGDKVCVDYVWDFDIIDNDSEKVLAGGSASTQLPNRIFMEYKGGKWQVTSVLEHP